jgi:hypothetical protein
MVINTVRIQYVYSTVADPLDVAFVPMMILGMIELCGRFRKQDLAHVLISNIGQDTRLTAETRVGPPRSLHWREKMLENTKASVHTLYIHDIQ